VFAGDLLHRCGALLDSLLAGAVKFEEERRLEHAIQLRVLVDGIELRFVEQLDARHGMPS